ELTDAIVRKWHGRVSRERADEYLQLMYRVAIPDYQSTPGNLGALCLHRHDDKVTHVVMLSFWRDMDAIHRFAGADALIAKYYAFDDDFLLEKEETVQHYAASGILPSF